jgi:pimeloyl-ACP methyl ester carboxylesterase
MSFARVVPLIILVFGSPVFAQSPPAPQDVMLSAADGTTLKGTYYAAPRPGPAVLLLHMCNTTRTSWEPLGPQLAAAGIHALAVDYRGFGESGGERFDPARAPEAQKMVNDTWPGDIDTAYNFLLAQAGVDRSRVGAAGGSCGVIQAARLARRHPEVRSLVLLAGPLDTEGLTFITETQWLPIFAAAAADDQYDDDAPGLMQWILAMSGHPRNRFSGFKDGKHGTEIFGPHPELVTQIVAWFSDTLVTYPADPKMSLTVRDTPAREFWRKAVSPTGVSAAVQLFHETRKRDPRAVLIPEAQLNLLGYLHLQAGRTEQAIELFTVNTLAYPASANTYDSLGDAYLAGGQNEPALRASEKAIALLATSALDDNRKKTIRDSAEQKIAKIKGRK